MIMLSEGNFFNRKEYEKEPITLDELVDKTGPKELKYIKSDLDRTFAFRRKDIESSKIMLTESQLLRIESTASRILTAYTGLAGEYIQGFGSIALAISFNIHCSRILLEDCSDLRERLPVDDIFSDEYAFTILHGVMKVVGHHKEFNNSFETLNRRCLDIYSSLEEVDKEIFFKLFPDKVLT